ncbi:unnamed protein product, partial [Pocillopora meandrina]
ILFSYPIPKYSVKRLDSVAAMIFNESNTTYYNIPSTVSPGESGTAAENQFFKWSRIAAYSVICVTGVLGNLLVILASRKPGMTTVSNVLIANLGLADLTVSLINMPTVVTYSHLVYWPFGAALCKLVPFLQGLTLSASVGTLVAIAAERYWHIVLYTRRKLTVREAHKAIVLIWVSAIFIPVPLLVFSKTIRWNEGGREICIEEWPNLKTRQAYTTLVFLLLYFLPLLFICGLYVRIGRFLKTLPTTQSVNNRNQRKVIKMLVTVVLLFGLCWLPYHIVYMYAEFSLSQLTPPFISFILFAQWLMFTNSACNPIVYAALNNNFRGAFLSILFFSSRKQPRRRRRTASTSVQVVQSSQ